MVRGNFYYTDSYLNLPADVTSPEVSTEGWHDIKVPGNWEVQGFGTAIYTNHGYEFQPRNPQPPLLPEKNPVECTGRDITVPSNGRAVIFTFTLPEQNQDAMCI